VHEAGIEWYGWHGTRQTVAQAQSGHGRVLSRDLLWTAACPIPEAGAAVCRRTPPQFGWLSASAVAAVFAPIAPVFESIQPILGAVAHVFATVAPIFDAVHRSTLVSTVEPVFAPVNDVLPAIADILAGVAAIFAPIPNVLDTVANRPALYHRSVGDERCQYCGDEQSCNTRSDECHGEPPHCPAESLDREEAPCVTWGISGD
jgi:hypothetical protein